jgi:hypothetical protein
MYDTASAAAGGHGGKKSGGGLTKLAKLFKKWRLG